MHEFYTTEQHYVEALQLLVEVSDYFQTDIFAQLLKIVVLSINRASRQSSWRVSD